MLEQFDSVIVVSEASKLRRLVSELKHPKKIQWIHTDYARWSQFSEWSRAVTKRDAFLYPKFDQIVVLSEHCKKGFVEKIPEVADKTVVIPNLIDGDRILKLTEEPCLVEINPENLNLVTVARIDREKRIDKVLELANQLKQNGIHVYVVYYRRRTAETRTGKEKSGDGIRWPGSFFRPFEESLSGNGKMQYAGTAFKIRGNSRYN